MLKYINNDIVFQEIPDEVTLAINISNCPCRCPGCHSKFLWADIGELLNQNSIDAFMNEYGRNITCICFMGGDSDPQGINNLAKYIKNNYSKYSVGWYTGRTLLSSEIDIKNFDYIKIGPYIAHLGSLKNPKTNQRLYKVNHKENKLEDITSRFWRNVTK